MRWTQFIQPTDQTNPKNYWHWKFFWIYFWQSSRQSICNKMCNPRDYFTEQNNDKLLFLIYFTLNGKILWDFIYYKEISMLLLLYYLSHKFLPIVTYIIEKVIECRWHSYTSGRMGEDCRKSLYFLCALSKFHLPQ